MEIVFHILMILVLLGLSAFFAGAETAVFSLSKIEKRRVEKAHPHLSHWLMRLLNKPRRTLITILIGNLFVNILATSMVTLLALHYFNHNLVGIVLALFTVLLIFFGEIMPKIFAVRSNETFALWAALPLRIFAWFVLPIRFLMQKVTDAFVSLMTFQHHVESDDISEDELKSMVKVGEEDGILDRQERYMIQKLFELGERPIKDILTPRVDLKALDIEDSDREHIDLVRQYHFTQFPVYEDTIDNIIGVVSSQEYMLRPKEGLQEIMTQPLIVPETKRIDDLLTEFKEKDEQFAVCVDEYGGTAGIVTLEDILEEIFGEYYDEYAQVESPIRPFGHQEYLVQAKISLADFNEYFDTNLEAEEASSLGGFIFESLGEVPIKGTVLDTEECIIRIHQVLRRRRIHNVVVHIKEKPEEEEDA